MQKTVWLHFAAANGYVGCVNALMTYKVSESEKNKNDKTPLQLAEEGGHTGCVYMLNKEKQSTTEQVQDPLASGFAARLAGTRTADRAK